MEIRPIRAEDLEHLASDTYGKTLRGVIVKKDDKVIGMGGIIHTMPLQWFGEVTDELRSHPRSLVKAAKLMRSMLESYTVPVYALADEDERDGKFLEYMGFTKANDIEDYYQWLPHPS